MQESFFLDSSAFEMVDVDQKEKEQGRRLQEGKEVLEQMCPSKCRRHGNFCSLPSLPDDGESWVRGHTLHLASQVPDPIYHPAALSCSLSRYLLCL